MANHPQCDSNPNGLVFVAFIIESGTTRFEEPKLLCELLFEVLSHSFAPSHAAEKVAANSAFVIFAQPDLPNCRKSQVGYLGAPLYHIYLACVREPLP